MGGLIDVIESNVSKVAPLLGAVLGSPFSGIGISLLANLFGVDSKNVEGIQKAISSDPEALVKIRALEYEHAATLAKIAAEAFATEVEDRKSARSREVALRDYVPTILALGFLANYAAIQFYCVTHPSAALDVISARFQDVLIMIMSYYFGSSHKSPEVLKRPAGD